MAGGFAELMGRLMFSAPTLQRVEASPEVRYADRKGQAGRKELTDAEYARERLRGTVWDRPLALAAYRVTLALGRRLGRLGVSADGLTLASLGFAVAAGATAAFGHFVTAAALVVVSGACDLLDGIVARAREQVSRYGALLDSTVDRLADGLPLLGVVAFYAGAGRIVVLPALAMMGAFIVSYVRARAEALGGTLPPLYMRRAERVALLVVTLLLGAVTVEAPVRAPLLLLGVGIVGILNFAGAWSAIRSARRALAGPRRPGITEPSE